jgi:hypothetical protein
MKQLSALFLGLLASALAGCLAGGAATAPPPAHTSQAVRGATPAIGPHASSVIIVIMENRDYDLVIGNPQAPYINNTLVPEAALMTNSHAITHPSQPNYLALFSGSTQGIIDDSCPHTFSTPNLGASLIAAGKGFDGYSESMPHDGYKGCATNLYARKHNPWVNFTNVPRGSNLVWTDIPKRPPTVAIIVPNLCNDMHDCSTMTGHNWLKANLPAILQYQGANSGLLVLTWDEADPDQDGTNHIPTLLLGPMIVPGSYAQDITHYSVLHTIEKIVKQKCIANACSAPLITGIWQ